MAADYALAFSDGGYTTSVPLEDLTGDKAWIAYEYDGPFSGSPTATRPTAAATSSDAIG